MALPNCTHPVVRADGWGVHYCQKCGTAVTVRETQAHLAALLKQVKHVVH